MSKVFWIFIFLPGIIFAGDKEIKGLLQIDVLVKVVSNGTEELWSLDLTKFTIDGRAVSINLKGFDGELLATMTPVEIGNNMLVLKTSSIVKHLESGEIISISQKELVTGFNESIIFYPIGHLDINPNVILELIIKRYNGVNVEN